MDVRFRVTPDDRALYFHLRLRVPYGDVWAATKALERILADLLRRTG